MPTSQTRRYVVKFWDVRENQDIIRHVHAYTAEDAAFQAGIEQRRSNPFAAVRGESPPVPHSVEPWHHRQHGEWHGPRFQ